MIRRLLGKKKKSGGMSAAKAGTIFFIVIIPVLFFGFTKYNPFDSPYTVTVYVESANSLKQGQSFVRTAGVNVGRVQKVEALPDGTAKVELAIYKIGWPVHSDAEIKIRPRIFLEGNFFVDLHPGSPSAPRLPDTGGVIPINQTAIPVQFGQVLTALQSDTRQNLRTFLAEFSIAGLGGNGAQSYNASIPYWKPAYQSTSLANTATLGTQPHDLSGVLRGQARTFRALDADPAALKGLITKFNITAHAFAREDNALEADIPALRDVLRDGPEDLRSVNAALPSLRQFARDALPGTKSTPEAIDAQVPFLRQARQLVSQDELKGLAHDLRPTIPALARLNRSQIPFLEQQAIFSSCQNQVIIPFLKDTTPDPDFPGLSEPVYKEANRAFVGLAGESRTGDANGQWFRINSRTGGTASLETGPTGDSFVSQIPGSAKRTRPDRPPEGDPVFRPNVPCETQEKPNLEAPSSTSGKQMDLPLPKITPELQKILDQRLSDAFSSFAGTSRLNAPGVGR